MAIECGYEGRDNYWLYVMLFLILLNSCDNEGHRIRHIEKQVNAISERIGIPETNKEAE